MEHTKMALVKALRDYLAPVSMHVNGATETSFIVVPVETDTTRHARELLRKLEA